MGPAEAASSLASDGAETLAGEMEKRLVHSNHNDEARIRAGQDT